MMPAGQVCVSESNGVAGTHRFWVERGRLMLLVTVIGDPRLLAFLL